MTRVRLFTSAYLEKNSTRASELADALARNLANPHLDEICLFVEGTYHHKLLDSAKVRTRSILERPTYAGYFQWMSDLTSPEDVSIVANSDIYFDEQLALFKVWKPGEDVALCLSRWETAKVPSTLNDRNDSQDTWVFTGAIRNVVADFPVGVPRCDNRIAHELEAAGYRVTNPSFSIRTFHVHREPRKEYTTENESGFIAPPYRYIWPHNLWSLPRTIAHNLAHPESRVGWRVDRRKVSQRLKLHWFGKLYRIFHRPATHQQ